MLTSSTLFITNHFLALWLVAILLTRYFRISAVGFLFVVRTLISSECCHLVLRHCINCLIPKHSIWLCAYLTVTCIPLNMKTMLCAQIFLLTHRLSHRSQHQWQAMATRMWLTHAKGVGEKRLNDFNITKHA